LRGKGVKKKIELPPQIMPWRPSTDPRFHKQQSTPFWEALQSVFDDACPVTPVPRRGGQDRFHPSEYLIDRQGLLRYDRKALLSTIPRVFWRSHIGPTEIQCLDFLFNNRKDRILSLVGTRGSGKTSLINYLAFLLDQKRNPETPFLLIIDGNRAAAPGIMEFTQQLGDDIENLANRGSAGGLPDAMTMAFRHGCKHLSGPHDRDQVLHALGSIVERLPQRDARLLVLVFDNLDPLTPESAESAFQLARDVNLAHGIGSILCLRPSLFRLVGDRGGARQIVNTFERVYPPTLTAWLEAFPNRMKQALRELQKTTPRVAHDAKISLSSMERACQRFASLVVKAHRREDIRPRRPEDDPTEFLESVSAQDMRHLTALIRRMLENHRLPSEWLLSPAGSSSYDEAARYHPISAAMEGGWRCYRHIRFVSNVLCFEKKGDLNVLIFHRLLCLLADNDPQRTEDLLKWTSEFGYESELTIEALEVLQTGNLVYGSNLDVTWSQNQRPEFCGLTEAGKYFLNHLLSNADYLTAAVMDVPLEHRFLTDSPKEFFPARLHSLMEYLIEVRKRENRQISDLKRNPITSSLKVVVDRLRNGGTLTSKIFRGLQEAIGRGRNSESFKVREVALALQGAVTEYEGVVADMESALWEVRQRAMKHVGPIVIPQLELQDADSRSDMRVQFIPVGDTIEASVTLHTNETATGALACVLDQERGQQIATAFLQLKGSSNDSATLAGKFQYTPPENSPSSPPTIQSISLSLRDRPIAILSTSRNRQGGAKVELCMWDPKGLKRDEIGEIANCDELCKWADEKLAEVSKDLLDNKLGGAKLRGIGTQLGLK
jgi:energy-coupling factor transporter ATP-binding protein EcfA2